MTILNEKQRADTMRQFAEYPENEYWVGYRLGLTADSPQADVINGMIGSVDRGRDARGRGYRDGCAYREKGIRETLPGDSREKGRA